MFTSLIDKIQSFKNEKYFIFCICKNNMRQIIKKPNIKISPIRTLKIVNPAADLSKPISKARAIKYIVSSIFSKYFVLVPIN